MAKLLMPLFIASFLFISKRTWWTILVSVLVDIWCISNSIYFKTYDTFLTINDILLAGNMDGAWSSITAYFDWSMLAMLLLSLGWCGICLLFKTLPQRNWIIFVILLVTTFALSCLNNYFIYNYKFWASSDNIEAHRKAKEEYEWIEFVNNHGSYEQHNLDKWGYLPFFNVYIDAAYGGTTTTNNFIEQYIRQHSIISDFVAINIYSIFCKEQRGEIINLSEDETEEINSFINHNFSPYSFPTNNLIVILVESLENWPLHHDIEGQNVTPYLRSMINKRNVLYCDKITSQALGGNSGDGQMIINSGLLPTQGCVACMCYGDDFYPNFAHFYEASGLVNPWPIIWNQDTMCIRYSFYDKMEPSESQWEDAQVFNVSTDYLKQTKSPMCILAITVSTHSPFNRIRNSKIKTSAPALLDRYMKCLNYTDSCIGAFVDTIMATPNLSNSTIVITGDHTIFKSSMLTEFKDYATTQNLSIASGDNYCPLIIYSPQIEGNIQVTDTCYQMDIYPTILHLIGCEDYYWKGFGVNLLDSAARHNRPITEQEAYRLSDLMIRSNYFEQYKP